MDGLISSYVLRQVAIDEDAGLIDVRNSTKAIFFLGTPHYGSGLAPMGETLRKMVDVCGVDPIDKNIRALHADSTELKFPEKTLCDSCVRSGSS